MAVRFDATTDQLERTASLPDMNAAYTWMGWAYFTSLPTTRASTPFLIQTNAGGANSCDYVQINSAVTHHMEWGNSISNAFTSTTGTTNIVTGTWYHLALVRTSTTALQGYLNGVAEGAGITTNIGARAAAARMEMGGFDTSSDWMDGRLAYVTIWNRALTAAEILNQMRTIRPQFFTGSVWGFWPLWPNQRTKDLSGNARDWTEAGTLTDEDPPPVQWGGYVIGVSVPAAGGTDATLSAGVATATALSPTSAITGSATLSAGVTTATALSPTATVAAGAVLSANAATATALSPVAAFTTGAVLSALAATATALSPTSTITGGAILTALAATATALSPTASISAASAGTLSANVATATAQAPTATISAAALLAALAATATALAPGATFTTGAVVSAGVATATASAPVASITGGGPPSAVVPRCPVTVRARNLRMHAHSRSFGIRAPRRSFALTVRNC